MEIENELPVIHDHPLQNETDADLAAYCDLHDLLATVHDPAQDVIVYRLHGQVAFTIKNPNEEHCVSSLKWKPDGTLLAVGMTNGWCGIYSGENGKMVGQTSVRKRTSEDDWKLDLVPNPIAEEGTEDEEIPIAACLGWTAHELPSSQAIINGYGPHETPIDTTESWFDGTEDISDIDANGFHANCMRDVTGLADSITRRDVSKIFPRLSPIASHGARSTPDSSKFSNQASLDSLFDNRKGRSNAIDTFLISGTTGYTHVLLDDSVKIGTFEIDRGCTKHASHPRCASQVLLSKDDETDGKYRLHYIDLPLETLGGSLLNVIALNAKRMQSLMEYITHTMRCIQHDAAIGTDLSSKLLHNVNEELFQKPEEGDIFTNLFHLAMTGTFTPTMLEWLTDIIKETTHKRWDQAINGFYTNIQNHISWNLLPALDRLDTAISALRGQARLHEGTSRFDVPVPMFSDMLDHVDSFRLIAQKTQLIITTEHRQFRAFSRWMRVMIEIGVAGPGSKGAIETEEREMPNIDYSLVLEYIRTTLVKTKMMILIGPVSDMQGSVTKEDFFQNPMVIKINRANIIQLLPKLDSPNPSGQPNEGDNHILLLNMPVHAVCLAGRVRVAMEFIMAWQSKMLPRHVTRPLITPLLLAPTAMVKDIRMIPDNDGTIVSSVVDLLTLNAPREGEYRKIYLHRINRLANSQNYESPDLMYVFREPCLACSPSKPMEMSVHADRTARRDIPGIEEVHDAKFWDERSMLMLFTRDDAEQDVLAFYDFMAEDTTPLRILHAYDPPFKPRSFIFGGRKGKMVCVVFNEKGQGWKIHELPRLGTHYDSDHMRYV